MKKILVEFLIKRVEILEKRLEDNNNEANEYIRHLEHKLEIDKAKNVDDDIKQRIIDALNDSLKK